MFGKSVIRFIFYVALLLGFSNAFAAVCSSLNVSGMPTGPVAVTANTPISFDLTITGGLGYNAETYSIKILVDAKNGRFDQYWDDPTGSKRNVKIVYTPSSSFTAGVTDLISFVVRHGYGDCDSTSQVLKTYEAQCNGYFNVVARSYAPTSTPASAPTGITVSWAGSSNLWTDVNTEGFVTTPSYQFVQLDSTEIPGKYTTPTLGALSNIAVGARANAAPGKRLSFTYKHSEKSSGNDTIKFRIEDQSISDATARASCGATISIPVTVNDKPDTYYCGNGWGADISATAAAIDKGGEYSFTVIGAKSSTRSDGKFIYKIASSLSNGNIEPAEVKSEPQSGSYSYKYKHLGSSMSGDTISVEVRDADYGQYAECVRTLQIAISINDPCAALILGQSKMDAILQGKSTDFTITASGGSGKYQYKIIGFPVNGSITSATDSGAVESDSYKFSYQHDETKTAGDTVTVEVTDVTTGCKNTIGVAILLADLCEGFGFKSNEKSMSINVGGNGDVTLDVNKGKFGSGQYVFSIHESPTQGNVTPNEIINSSSASVAYSYSHTGTMTDTFIVRVKDKVNTSCVSDAKVSVAFCSAFDAGVTLTPETQTIAIGGTYSFTAAVKSGTGSGRYRYSIKTNPTKGTVTPMNSGEVSSLSQAFSYQHTNNVDNTSGETITVVIEDLANSCTVEKTVKMEMGDLCANFTAWISKSDGTSILNQTTVGGVGTEQLFNVWAKGGSGSYSFTHTASHLIAGVLTTKDQVTKDGKVTQNYTYLDNAARTQVLRFQVRDTKYNCAWPSSTTWAATTYNINGTQGNTSCATLGISVSGISTSLISGQAIQVGRSVDFTVTRSGGDDRRTYDFTVSALPSIGGTITALGQGASVKETKFRYTAPANAIGQDFATMQIADANDPLCLAKTQRIMFNVSDSTDTCSGFDTGSDVRGDVIIDMTGNPGVVAIASNVKFMAGCRKEITSLNKTADSNTTTPGVDVININNYKIVTAIPNDTTRVKVSVGAEHGDDVVTSNLAGDSSKRLNYFTEGLHLFDLDKLRNAADWLSGETNDIPNVASRPNASGGLEKLEPNTYGTITMRQFLENVRDGKTMHGMVRVLVGLEKGSCANTAAGCNPNAKNVLGAPVNESELYSFCSQSNKSGLCSCAPGRPDELGGDAVNYHFGNISPNAGTLCLDSKNAPLVLPKLAKVMVKGSLFWDFVDYADPTKPVPLESLSFYPRDLYFMVGVPIIINSAYDGVGQDYCGGENYAGCTGTLPVSAAFRTQVERIRDAVVHVNATANTYPFNRLNGIDISHIPQTSRDQYKYIMKDTLDNNTKLRALPINEQFYMLAPSGYAKGWASAFKHLQVTAGQWKALGFGVPSKASSSSPLGEDDIRDKGFEDIPVYLYSGGLVDMHTYVNISGLIYVPQAIELEAEEGGELWPSTTNQYGYRLRQLVVGAIVIRDGFYFKAKGDSILVIVSDPTSYASARLATMMPKEVSLPAGKGGGTAPADDPSHFGDVIDNSTANNCVLTCEGASQSNDASIITNSRPRWQQIYPKYEDL